MKKVDTKFKQFLQIISLFVILVAIIFVIAVNENRTSGLNHHTDWSVITECEVINASGNEMHISLPQFIPMSKEYTINIDASNYDNVQSKFLSIYLSYCSLYAYADEKLIYSREVADDAIIPSGASYIHMIPIPDEMSNSIITLEIIPTIEVSSGVRIPEIYIGDKGNLLFGKILDDFLMLVACSMIIIVFLCISIWGAYRGIVFKNHDYTIIYISMVGIIVANYFMTQMWSFMYFMNNMSIAVYFIEYSSLMTSGIPALLVVKNNLNKKMAPYINVMMIVLVSNITVQYLLMLYRISEFKYFLSLDHFLLVLTALVILVSFIVTDEKEYPAKMQLRIFVFVLVIAFIMPSLYELIYEHLVVQYIIIIFILVSVGAEVTYMFKRYKKIEADNIKNRHFEEMALIDSLTSLPNRRSFDNLAHKVKEEKINGWIFSLDLNDLKMTNDKYGHHVGDEMIINFSYVLSQQMADIDTLTAFRLGGDEFAMFWEADRADDAQKHIQAIKSKFDFGLISDSQFQAIVAIGCSYYDSNKMESLHDAYVIADRNMYSDKNNCKDQMPTKIYRFVSEQVTSDI